jgi:hypothetical protein
MCLIHFCIRFGTNICFSQNFMQRKNTVATLGFGRLSGVSDFVADYQVGDVANVEWLLWERQPVVVLYSSQETTNTTKQICEHCLFHKNQLCGWSIATFVPHPMHPQCVLFRCFWVCLFDPETNTFPDLFWEGREPEHKSIINYSLVWDISNTRIMEFETGGVVPCWEYDVWGEHGDGWVCRNTDSLAFWKSRRRVLGNSIRGNSFMTHVLPNAGASKRAGRKNT